MIDIKKHKLTKYQIADAKKYGIKVELEHTTSRRKAFEIALQHEIEFPGYYEHGLIPMEAKLKKRKMLDKLQ